MHRLLAVALVTPLSLAACSGRVAPIPIASTDASTADPAPAPAPRLLRDPAPCTSADARFAALPLQKDVDGVALYELSADGPHRLVPIAAPCARATDAAACAAQIDALAKSARTYDPPRGSGQPAPPPSPPVIELVSGGLPQSTYLLAVATRGDTVEALVTLNAVLDKVETTEQAVAVLLLANQQLTCDALSTEPSASGFLFRSEGGCPRTETIVEVRADRSIRFLERRALETVPPGSCPTY